MQYVLRYEILPGKNGEFVSWMRDNEANLAEHTPDGWEYAGTYLTVRGFGSHEVESRWNLDGYAALGAGWGDETGLRLTQEWYAFTDQSRTWEASLLKSTTEVDVLPGA